MRNLDLVPAYICAALSALCVVLVFWPNPRDATDNTDTGARSGMRLFTDHETKCQYIGARNSSITPRLDAQGKHMCGSKGVSP